MQVAWEVVLTEGWQALSIRKIAAATEQVDATPMEGFNADALDALLDLLAKGLHSVALLAVGYRDAEKDFLSGAPKVRRAHKDLFIELA